ncbi:MAG: sugar-transfer associated ATP-grasp domain-containing protein [bacterium]
MANFGILGINARNLKYIRPSNPRRAIRRIDNKLLTKRLLRRAGIKTPRSYGIIASVKELEKFNWDKLPISFVVKPSMGYGGEGIMVLRHEDKKKVFLKKPVTKRTWLTDGGERKTFADLHQRILDILDGNFSLHGTPDIAFMEKRLVKAPLFKKLCKSGTPDIRVIVYNRVPVMAMMRIPTELSGGRANVSQGAIACGIDIATGQTTTAVMKGLFRTMISKHPDTGADLEGIEIPFWEDILKMSVEAWEVSNLGFLGVDIAIDKKDGPNILELNARPGLEIQVANSARLAKRLDRVEGLKIKTAEKGIRVAKELFGGDLEKRIESVSGKEVLGIIENIQLISKKGRKRSIKAKIDTGAAVTSIDETLAIKLGFRDAVSHGKKWLKKKVYSQEEIKQLRKDKVRQHLLEHEDIVGVIKNTSSHGNSYRIRIPLTFYMSGKKIVSRVSVINRKELYYPIIIGRHDLQNFLIDPGKNPDPYSKY